MYGKNIQVVKCERDVKGTPCSGLIQIPLGDKGQCPKCGHVTGWAEHLAYRNVRTKSAAVGVKV